MKHLSSLWTIWYKPRATVRQGLESPSPAFELVVAAFFGISSFLDRAEKENYGDDWSLGWIVLTLAAVVIAIVVVSAIGLLGTQ
jgi:hypothetical protein